MKLYLLQRADKDVGWDQYAGFVVAAPDEETARAIAKSSASNEGVDVWGRVACVEIAKRTTLKEGVVLGSYVAG